MNYEYIDLKLENGKQLKYNKEVYKKEIENLEELIHDIKYMHTLKFAKKIMFNNEIKTNNNIEEINNELSNIDDVIKRKKTNLKEIDKKRIINLYHGYKYILTNKNINKESLKELYFILSKDILNEHDKTNMGEYYRTKPVYILKSNYIDKDIFMGMPEEKLDYYMNQLFNYINNDNPNEKIDIFIKSQIMHFYFVYIHPYFDVNGRTSRTLSMWYLLNNNTYPYIIFNRAIAYSKTNYEKSIINARENGNITLFLKYLLSKVEIELEKEYFFNEINKKINNELTKDELEILEYILTMNGNITVKDFAIIYNNYNEKRNTKIILEEKIMPLIKKNILIQGQYTKKNIN